MLDGAEPQRVKCVASCPRSHPGDGFRFCRYNSFFSPLWELGITDCPVRATAHSRGMASELAKQAWFIRVVTAEKPRAMLVFAVGVPTLEQAIAAILHRPELDLGDEVTSTSQLTPMEIISYRLRPDEVRTYGRRIYDAGMDWWTLDRVPTVPKTNT